MGVALVLVLLLMVVVVVGVRRRDGRRWEASLFGGLGHMLPHRNIGVVEVCPFLCEKEAGK